MAKFLTVAPSNLKLYNVVLLGVCFCLLFSGFHTMAGVQTLIFNSAKNPASDGYVEGFNVNGLWSLAGRCLVFTLANFVSPTVVAALGPKFTLLVAGTTFIVYCSVLLIMDTGFTYAACVLHGLGSSLIWTAQGNFLAINSDPDTITRNSGIFWALFSSSGMVGNLFAYYQFQGKGTIDTSTRNILGTVLLCAVTLGTILILFLRSTPWMTKHEKEKGAKHVLKESLKLFLTKDMLLLCFMFYYTGIHLNIWIAVYNTCIGFTHAFGDDRKGLATVSGIFISMGEVIGGTIFVFFGHKAVKRGRSPVLLFGFVLASLAYLLAWINLPDASTLGETLPNQTAIIESNKFIAILTSFLLGFSDACINTQVFSLLGGTFKDHSAAAFALYKLLQQTATGIAFCYSPLLLLHWQLLIAVVFGGMGTAAFCIVEHNQKRRLALAIASEEVKRKQSNMTTTSLLSQDELTEHIL